MENWQASYDTALIESGERSGEPETQPDQECDLCERMVYKLHGCDGCGEMNVCDNCVYTDEEGRKFCCVECVP